MHHASSKLTAYVCELSGRTTTMSPNVLIIVTQISGRTQARGLFRWAIIYRSVRVVALQNREKLLLVLSAGGQVRSPVIAALGWEVNPSLRGPLGWLTRGHHQGQRDSPRDISQIGTHAHPHSLQSIATTLTAPRGSVPMSGCSAVLRPSAWHSGRLRHTEGAPCTVRVPTAGAQNQVTECFRFHVNTAGRLSLRGLGRPGGQDPVASRVSRTTSKQ